MLNINLGVLLTLHLGPCSLLGHILLKMLLLPFNHILLNGGNPSQVLIPPPQLSQAPQNIPPKKPQKRTHPNPNTKNMQTQLVYSE